MKNYNIILIGMPGAGKSTVGILLAKTLSCAFIDTDVYVQAKEGKSLQDIIDNNGMETFCNLEEEYVLSLNLKRYVIATGGSVVYSKRAMKHLKENGLVVYLKASLPIIRKRIRDIDTRGIVKAPKQTLNQLYNERTPLYGKYADYVINCNSKTHEQIISEICKQIK